VLAGIEHTLKTGLIIPNEEGDVSLDNIWLFLFSGNGTAPQSVVVEVAVDGLRRIDNYGQVGGGGRPDRGIFSQ